MIGKSATVREVAEPILEMVPVASVVTTLRHDDTCLGDAIGHEDDMGRGDDMDGCLDGGGGNDGGERLMTTQCQKC